MIAYFDTSALVPLLVDEAGSERAGILWNDVDRAAAVRLVYAEARAALAAAMRGGRISRSALNDAIGILNGVYGQLDIVEVSDALVRRAGFLAEAFALCGHDAVHLAAAESLSGDDFAFVAGDGLLCRAAEAVGLAVARI